jgi:hypothetical protein
VPGGAAGEFGGEGDFLRGVDGTGFVELLGGLNVVEMVGGEAMIDLTPEI